ncbi:hypothetical protein AZF01_06435 [Martelella sp. AD-3]|nr:hypothetical protein AZF01_06435 [Martelella sp. AD-3]
MPQKETGKLLSGPTPILHRRRAGPHQVADRFMSFIGNPDCGELIGAMQACQQDGISAVCLNPVSRARRCQRWRNDDAILTEICQLPVKDIAAGTGLVAEAEYGFMLPELGDQTSNGFV